MSPKPRLSSAPAPAHPLQAQNEVVARLHTLPHVLAGALGRAPRDAGHASGDTVTLADPYVARHEKWHAAPRRPSSEACSPWSKTTSGCGGGAARPAHPAHPQRRGSRSPTHAQHHAARSQRAGRAMGGRERADERSRWRCESCAVVACRRRRGRSLSARSTTTLQWRDRAARSGRGSGGTPPRRLLERRARAPGKVWKWKMLASTAPRELPKSMARSERCGRRPATRLGGRL